jgi:hypothetical protein
MLPAQPTISIVPINAPNFTNPSTVRDMWRNHT